ncbi:MAG: exo-alpha-sialidase [Armatimonadetes bacterium]|nr:exo-alpha-sialidase [Armatimonadota bacterium]
MNQTGVERIVRSCLGPLSMLFFVISARGEDLRLTDEFAGYRARSDGSPTWVSQYGTWVMRNGRCEQVDASAEGAYLFRPDTQLADLDFSVRFLAKSGGVGVRAPGMVFRAVSNMDCYYVHYDTRNSQVLLVLQTEMKEWTELARVRGVKIAQNQWHVGRVIGRGPQIEVYLDGSLVATATDSTFPAGAIGLRAGQGVVWFDGLKVEGTKPVEGVKWMSKIDQKDESKTKRLLRVRDKVAVSGGGYFPVLVKLHDGSLGAVARGGAPHVGKKGRLDWIHSRDGGRTWSKPKVVVDSEWDDRNPAAGVMPDGSIVVSYAEASTYNDKGQFDMSVGKYEMFYVRSEDKGKTWSLKIPLCPDLFGYGSPYGRIIVQRDGTALMPLYLWPQKTEGMTGSVTKRQPNGAGIIRSRDNGHTWGDWTEIAADHNETSLEELEDGGLIASMRTVAGAVSVSKSSDSGRVWTKPRLITKPGQHPPDLCRLRSGALLMVFGCRLEPKGVQAILSDDGGKTWSFDNRVFLAWKCLNGDCGYPSVVQAKDGTVVVMYYAVGTADSPEEQARCVRLNERRLR